jgi:hypothetical protein
MSRKILSVVRVRPERAHSHNLFRIAIFDRLKRHMAEYQPQLLSCTLRINIYHQSTSSQTQVQVMGG